MNTPWFRLSALTLLAGMIVLAPMADAKAKKPKTPPVAPKDEIQVVGHIPVADGAVTRFLATQHYSSSYLYAERGPGKNVTLIDVTMASRPAVLADIPSVANGGPSSLTVVAGTAALVSNEPVAAVSASAPQTIRIMDFSDPKNPKVAREFAGVTAMSRDDRRGLIFIANAEGIWILQQHLAEDPDVEKAYEHYVLYSH